MNKGRLRVTNDLGKRQLAPTAMAVALGILSGIVGVASFYEIAVKAQEAVPTHTTLETHTQQVGQRTVVTYSALVETEDGKPATGAVTLLEHGKPLAGAALSADGHAEIRYDALTAGDHTLRAVYAGDQSHAASQSDGIEVHADTTPAPAFTLGIDVVGSSTPSTMTITTPGQAGSLTATVTPENGFTGFLSLSCSGPATNSGSAGGSALPVGVSCTFTPLNLQVISASAVTAAMTLQTTAGQQNVAGSRSPQARAVSGGKLALAVLLPGLLAVGLLGRKRKVISRTALLAMVAAIGMIGTSSCAARYKYLNHGPSFDGTLPGTYTLTITAQTSNGVAASEQSQTLTLIVK